jgi:hypothetical protein
MRLPAVAIATAFAWGIAFGLSPQLREMLLLAFFFPLFSFL